MSVFSQRPFRVPNEAAAAYPGDRFGCVVVCGVPFYVARKTGARRQHVVAKCKCGQHFLVSCESLLSGKTKTCGCAKVKHGLAGTKLYSIWNNMIARCERRNTDGYEHYGARGISVCRKWHDFTIFREWAVSHGYAEGLRIERVDNDGGYTPENCRFVTHLEQMNNTRHNRVITAFGETKSIAQWARDPRCVVPAFTLATRTRNGVSPEKAITTRAKVIKKPIQSIRAFGETKSVSEWIADSRCVVDERTLRARLRLLGWSEEQAIEQPISDSQKRSVAVRRKRRRQRLARAKAKAAAAPKKNAKAKTK